MGLEYERTAGHCPTWVLALWVLGCAASAWGSDVGIFTAESAPPHG